MQLSPSLKWDGADPLFPGGSWSQVQAAWGLFWFTAVPRSHGLPAFSSKAQLGRSPNAAVLLSFPAESPKRNPQTQINLLGCFQISL